MDMRNDANKIATEVVGTFFFFFIGIGAAISVTQIAKGLDSGVQLLYIALAHGIALALAISALGHMSGGHFNPAVTIGLAVARKISPVLGALYILGQIVGGVLACVALRIILPEIYWKAANLGTPAIGVGIEVGMAVLMEAILTFFLVIAVFGTAVDPRAPKIGGFGIGLVVFVDILAGGAVSGGVMNPARAIAPAIVSGEWTNQWIWWVGPIIGGLVAALLYAYVFLPKESEA